MAITQTAARATSLSTEAIGALSAASYVAADASGGMCSVVLDAMGFRQFVIELTCDLTKTTNLGVLTNII